MTSDPLLVMLTDDNADFRAAAKDYFRDYPELCVVGAVGSGEEAMAFAGKTNVDLVLMDLAMPGMGGIEATRRIKSRPNAPKVIVVTMQDAAAYRDAAQAAGADGFVIKDYFSATIMPLIASLFRREFKTSEQ